MDKNCLFTVPSSTRIKSPQTARARTRQMKASGLYVHCSVVAWNYLPVDVVNAISLHNLKRRLDMFIVEKLIKKIRRICKVLNTQNPSPLQEVVELEIIVVWESIWKKGTKKSYIYKFIYIIFLIYLYIYICSVLWHLPLFSLRQDLEPDFWCNSLWLFLRVFPLLFRFEEHLRSRKLIWLFELCHLVK